MNNNGYITFHTASSSFTPIQLPTSVPSIAPFWADVDTRCAGSVFYRQTTASADITKANSDIHNGGFNYSTTSLVVVATWDHVGYHNCHADKVSNLNTGVVYTFYPQECIITT